MMDIRGLVWRLLDGCAYLLDCGWSTLAPRGGAAWPHAVAVYFHGVLDGPGDGLVDPQEGMTPDFLRRFIRALKSAGYTFVTPDMVHDAARPAGNLALLTSDDGYRSVEALLPILEEEAAPLTIFLTTESPARGGIYWWDQVHIAGCATSRVTSHLKHGVRSRSDRDTALRALGIDPSRPAYSESHRQLAPAEVARLATNPCFSFGNHSRSHLSLPLLADAEMHEEIEGARRDIESWIGKRVRHFAFPYGDHDPRTVRFLEGCGYAALFTVEPGRIALPADPVGTHLLPRYRLRADRSARWQARIMARGITVGPRLQARVRRWIRGRSS